MLASAGGDRKKDVLQRGGSKRDLVSRGSSKRDLSSGGSKRNLQSAGGASSKHRHEESTSATGKTTEDGHGKQQRPAPLRGLKGKKKKKLPGKGLVSAEPRDPAQEKLKLTPMERFNQLREELLLADLTTPSDNRMVKRRFSMTLGTTSQVLAERVCVGGARGHEQKHTVHSHLDCTSAGDIFYSNGDGSFGSLHASGGRQINRKRKRKSEGDAERAAEKRERQLATGAPLVVQMQRVWKMVPSSRDTRPRWLKEYEDGTIQYKLEFSNSSEKEVHFGAPMPWHILEQYVADQAPTHRYSVLRPYQRVDFFKALSIPDFLQIAFAEIVKQFPETIGGGLDSRKWHKLMASLGIFDDIRDSQRHMELDKIYRTRTRQYKHEVHKYHHELAKLESAAAHQAGNLKAPEQGSKTTRPSYDGSHLAKAMKHVPDQDLRMDSKSFIDALTSVAEMRWPDQPQAQAMHELVFGHLLVHNDFLSVKLSAWRYL
ncbi:unnamed protein product [Chrysoparadoxa australica]